MLNARILCDLPSAETTREQGTGDWARAMLGRPRDLGRREELTVSTRAVLDGVYRAFVDLGVTNASMLLVDGAPVYNDQYGDEHDLNALWRTAETAGTLARSFEVIELVLEGRDMGFALRFDVRIRRRVKLGEPEMNVDVTATPEEAGVDDAVRKRRFDRIVKRVADTLGKALIGAKVTVA
jgi:hypothetical protein